MIIQVFLFRVNVVLDNNLLKTTNRTYCGEDDSVTPTPINTFDCCEDDHIKTILNNGIALMLIIFLHKEMLTEFYAGHGSQNGTIPKLLIFLLAMIHTSMVD